MRYADDFVVFCHTQEEAEQARQTLEAWFKEQGLTFSPKTRIVNLDEGFDFLGFNIRQYKVTDSKVDTDCLSNRAANPWKRYGGS